MAIHSFFICDPQDITRLGFQAALQSISTDFSIQLIMDKKTLTEKLTPEEQVVIIIDYNLFKFYNLNEIVAIKEQYPGSEWIFTSSDVEVGFIHEFSQSLPNAGFIFKSDPIEDFISAITSAIQGRRYYSSQVLGLILGKLQTEKKSINEAIPNLTPTEREIVSLLVSGKSTKEIASNRCLSNHTVSTHRKNIFRKMQVNCVGELTKKALKVGLIDHTEYYI